MIVCALEGDNAALDQRDRVTIDSVRNHCGRHFPVQNAAKATYSDILERRAEENGIDFVNGVATALTPMAFFETVMVKAFEAIVDPNSKVDVSAGMAAAGRLQSLLDSRTEQPDWAELRRMVTQIGGAVRTTVPQEISAEIVSKLSDYEQSSRAIYDDSDDVPEAYEPNDLNGSSYDC